MEIQLEATPTYRERLDSLRETKLNQTLEKQAVLGSMDFDDWAYMLPPEERRKIVHSVSSSGLEMTDAILNDFIPESNHPSGGFFGAEISGKNFRGLLELHPVYIDPNSSLAGGYMQNFMSYRKPHWNPDYDFSHLAADHKKYNIVNGIGAVQHMCPDLEIGLDLGWGGLLSKIEKYRQVNGPEHRGFYDGLEHVVIGAQDWIRRHAEAAAAMVAQSDISWMKQNLQKIAEINRELVTSPPHTFRQACQWVLWYLMLARMYNGSGALGKFDQLLWPYYEHDIEAGRLTDEEAVFHIACLLLRDTTYFQLGGPDGDRDDASNPLSYLVLEAVDRLKIPVNAGVSVGEKTDPGLLKKGVEIIFENKQGIPKFIGIDNVVDGFIRNDFPHEAAVDRPYSGCNWHGVAGREYMIGDSIKVNLAAVFDAALRELYAKHGDDSSVDMLWDCFLKHLEHVIDVIVEGIGIHLAHMHEVFPELVLDLCCHGSLERGLDASHGGVDYTNINVDGAGLATAANSFASIKQQVEIDRKLSWSELIGYLDDNWAGIQGERTRLLMANTNHFGHGNSYGDQYAMQIARALTECVHGKSTPGHFKITPGFFGWALHIVMGKQVRATPDGRFSHAAISHGANPSPGFRKDGAPTALALAVAAVQPGLGNPAPLQLDMDPLIADDPDWLEKISTLLSTHFELGGTQINLNVMDRDKILEAYEDPAKYPDLIVRVTGFSAYFSSLSPELRKIVVDRIVTAE
jgi:formate C-acetyltransferase